MGMLLSEKEVDQFNLYYHPNEDDESEIGYCNYGCDNFFNDGDNCVMSYDKNDQHQVSTSALKDECRKAVMDSTKHRLFVVANRLPVSATRKGDNMWKLDGSVGGLVSALLGLEGGFEASWIGWPGVNVPDEVGQETLIKALSERKCIPVFLDEETVHEYYNGYCNNILWPLLHYLGLPQDDHLSTTISFQSQFEVYKKANQMFADVVHKHYREGDIVWCHDYHLMFLPHCLKEYNSKMKGFNATLTQAIESPSTATRSECKESGLDLHPDLHEALRRISCDPKTTLIVISGSDRNVLDKVFGSFNLWLAAENGMFLRHTTDVWIRTMPNCLDMEWIDSIKGIIEYFTVRTPRSSFELRDTSIQWNYKYADTEFGKIQERDLLQHLRRGPLSTSAVDVFRGARSVEVRAVGVTKGAAIDRMLAEIAYRKGMDVPINYVLCVGHFLRKDEDLYSFFEPAVISKTNAAVDAVRDSAPNMQTSLLKSDRNITHCRVGISSTMDSRQTPQIQDGRPILDLEGDNYFSCAVGRKHTTARYVVGSSDDVVLLLKKLAEISSPCQ